MEKELEKAVKDIDKKVNNMEKAAKRIKKFLGAMKVLRKDLCSKYELSDREVSKLIQKVKNGSM